MAQSWTRQISGTFTATTVAMNQNISGKAGRGFRAHQRAGRHQPARGGLSKWLRQRQLFVEAIATFLKNAVFITRRTETYECKYPDYDFLARGQTWIARNEVCEPYRKRWDHRARLCRLAPRSALCRCGFSCYGLRRGPQEGGKAFQR